VTSIPFKLSKAEKVDLVLLDISGRVVKVLVRASKDAGTHVINFNSGSLAAGGILLPDTEPVISLM
jgi:hypothetical protein